MDLKLKWLFIIILTIYLLTIIYYELLSEEYDTLPNNAVPIHFFTKEEAINLFKTDPDSYFERLTPIDLYAMKLKDTSDCITTISNASRSFTPDEQKLLIKAINDSDSFLESVNIPYFDNIKCKNLPWKLVITIGTVNEEGMPHTKSDVIYLSDFILKLPYKEIVRTLIHEKIHIYERSYPNEMNQWLTNNNYTRYRRQSEIPNARSNPDIDGWTYIDENGHETVVLYASNTPDSILDSIYPGDNDHPSSEHPYEKLAYMLDKMYMTGKVIL
jgi:hypothetical protein